MIFMYINYQKILTIIHMKVITDIMMKAMVDGNADDEEMMMIR